jgi:CubicO group peptidase (beta-lactamase class C family)
MKYLLFIVFALISISDSYAQDNISGKLEKLVDDYYKMDQFSGTVLVFKNDKPLLEKAIGYSNKETNTLNDIETVFNIGSIQKTFTEELIKMLVNEGKLKYEDKLGKYITGFKDKRAEDATIDQIINMKGGFGDFIMISDIRENASKFTTINDFLSAIKKKQLLFDPGTDEQYSNSGYVILGGVIEKITGKSYEEFLTERILKPLGMDHSYYVRGSVNKQNKASGYIVGPDGTISQPQGFDLAPTPAGSMYSNVHDLQKFADFLWDEAKGPMYDAFAGGLPGWNSVMGMFGDRETTVIILSNYDEPSAEMLLDQVLKVLDGKDYDPPKISLGNFIYSELNGKNKENFINNFESTLEKNGYKIENDNTLNTVGYAFLNMNMFEEAILVLKLNVKKFPGIANCYDSLGEAYMIRGNNKEAIKNYEKVLEMDPENGNAKKMLEKLKSM